MSLAHQDWKTVVLKKKPETKKPTGTSLLTAIQENKVEIVERPKYVYQSGISSAKAVKLDKSNEPQKHATISHDLKMTIQRAREEKKMDQADLARSVGVKVGVIRDYENGKAIPTPLVLNRIKKILGIQKSEKAKAEPKK